MIVEYGRFAVRMTGSCHGAASDDNHSSIHSEMEIVMKFTQVVLLLMIGIAVSACSDSQFPEQVAGDSMPAYPVAVDSMFPPAMHEFSFESGGSRLNALMYIANGPGPHPTVVLLHGYPGNERNLDLAQEMRRAGSNVLFFNYRGTWGSGGRFTVSHALEDVSEVLKLVRDRDWAAEHRSDPVQVALVGHSFGGFLGAITTAGDRGVSCFAFLAGANMGAAGMQVNSNENVRAALEGVFGSAMNADGGPINGNAISVVDEFSAEADKYNVASWAPALATRPLLLVAGLRDESLRKSDHHDRVIAALRDAGAERLTELVFNDDHSFSATRVELARGLVDWQQNECWR
jgi:pimeloyl-ACP methyl ester carboxylesterase